MPLLLCQSHTFYIECAEISYVHNTFTVQNKYNTFLRKRTVMAAKRHFFSHIAHPLVAVFKSLLVMAHLSLSAVLDSIRLCFYIINY